MSMHVDQLTAIAKSLQNDAAHRNATEKNGISIVANARRKKQPPSRYDRKPCSVRPQRGPQMRPCRSVVKPPAKQATPPKNSGANFAASRPVPVRFRTVS